VAGIHLSAVSAGSQDGKPDAPAGRLGFDVQKTEEIYQQYVVAHGLERENLFRLLHERFALETVLYPGCFLRVTPSFWLSARRLR
jgi:hypothetical protein